MPRLRYPTPAIPGRSVFLIAGLLFALGACSTMPAEDPRVAVERVQLVIASPIRTDQDRRMDAARHPAEFLPFTQVKPGMQVLDVSAGAGYTSQLLALAVGPTGTVWAQRQQPGEAFTKRLSDHPQTNLVAVIRPFEDPVPDQAPKLDLIAVKYADGHQYRLDGLSVEYDDWHFNVRASNTEPLLRVMLEGKHEHEIRAWAQEIVDVVKEHLG